MPRLGWRISYEFTLQQLDLVGTLFDSLELLEAGQRRRPHRNHDTLSGRLCPPV
jgi:hypothetical protein